MTILSSRYNAAIGCDARMPNWSILVNSFLLLISQIQP